MKKVFFAIALSVSSVFPVNAYATSLGEAEISALHASMVQHIDRQVIEGLYWQVDLKSGIVSKFSPAKSHPMVLTMGDNFVLCTDFKDTSGKPTNVDFYVARRGKGFAVFHTEIGNRGPLMKLMQEGKAASIN